MIQFDVESKIWGRTMNLRLDKRRSQFYPGNGFKEVLQQAWQNQTTGELKWEDVPIVGER
jgi:hypothetical protein